jgi:hypothetical protein
MSAVSLAPTRRTFVTVEDNKATVRAFYQTAPWHLVEQQGGEA